MDKIVRVYADGIFNLFHYGHAKMLEQAKSSFPNTYLIVGVCNDADTCKYKKKTILSNQERCESLRHCKWVDEIVSNAPWIITKEFIEQYEVDFVAHDDALYPLSDTLNHTYIEDVYDEVKKLDKFLVTHRTKGVSTTEIINRVLYTYNK